MRTLALLSFVTACSPTVLTETPASEASESLKANPESLVRPRGDGFGRALAAHGDALAIGNSFKSTVEIYTRETTGWKQTHTLAPMGEQFEGGIALDAQTLAVGAPSYKECHDASCQNHGVVAIFERQNGDWVETTRLQASDAVPFHVFGGALLIHDGQLFVSAVGDRTDTGAVYVFERNSAGEWQQRQKLTAADAQESDSFGFALAAENETLVIGAPSARGCVAGEGETAPYNTCNTAGRIYTFERAANGEWKESASIRPRRDSIPTFFGRNIAIKHGVLAATVPFGGNCPTLDRSACVTTGVVSLFTRKQGRWSQSAVHAFDADTRMRDAVAFAGDELVVPGVKAGELRLTTFDSALVPSATVTLPGSLTTQMIASPHGLIVSVQGTNVDEILTF